MKRVRGLTDTHSTRFRREDTHLTARFRLKRKLPTFSGVDGVGFDAFRPFAMQVVDALMEIFRTIRVVSNADMVPARGVRCFWVAAILNREDLTHLTGCEDGQELCLAVLRSRCVP